MGRGCRPLAAGCGCLLLPMLCVSAAAQDGPSATTRPAASAPARELPASVQESLSQVKDFSLNFDFPGYFALLEFVRHSDFDPGDQRGAIKIPDWQTLLDRPSDFRGEPITIEGVVGRLRSWQYRDATRRKRFGTVWELDLRHAQRGYPIAATVFLTNDAGDVGIDSTIQVTGYFVMVQQYPQEGRKLGQKIVIIAKGPSMISRAAPAAPRKRTEKRWVWGGAAVAAAMLVVWIMMRGSAKGELTGTDELTASHRAPMNLSDELENWADEDDSLQP